MKPLLLPYFAPFSGVSIANFEKVIVCSQTVGKKERKGETVWPDSFYPLRNSANKRLESNVEKVVIWGTRHFMYGRFGAFIN